MRNFKTIYLYRDSDLPEEGWQHPCFLCYTITGNEVDYKMVEKTDIFSRTKTVYNYVVYMCRTCEKKIKLDAELKDKYVKRCEKYIKSIRL